MSFTYASASHTFTWYESMRVRRILYFLQREQDRDKFLFSRKRKYKNMDIDKGSSCATKKFNSTCSGSDTGVRWKEQMKEHQNQHTRIFQCGSKQQVGFCTALHPMCTIRCWATFRMQRYQRCHRQGLNP